MNPYKVLGLKKNASQEEIKKAYRQLSKKYHPDATDGDKELEEKFKEVSEAYSILSDPNKKMRYDQFGSVDGRQKTGGNAWEGMFHDFFGANFGAPRNQRRSINPDTRSSLRISLADAIFGCERVQPIKRIFACETCKSSGAVKGTERTCEACNGQGQTIIRPNAHTQWFNTCGHCEGAGKTAKNCEKCKGVGFLQGSEKAKVKIPKNLKENATIRIKNKGNLIYQSDDSLYTGSHYIVIDYPKVEDGVFKKGPNLFTNVQVPIDKILAEDEVQIKLFNREDVTLKLKSDQDFYKDYVINPDFLNGGSISIKVLPQIPSKYVDEDKRKGLVKALREAYGESESTIYPANNGS